MLKAHTAMGPILCEVSVQRLRPGTTAEHNNGCAGLLLIVVPSPPKDALGGITSSTTASMTLTASYPGRVILLCQHSLVRASLGRQSDWA
jgi:hypothetical protein